MLKKIYPKFGDNIGRIFDVFPFPWKFIPSYRKASRSIEYNSIINYDNIIIRQKALLHSLLKKAYKGVPYYRKLFDSVSFDSSKKFTEQEFQKIPLLSRKEVFEHYEILINNNIKNYKTFEGLTGGTTGEPLKLKFSNESSFVEWAFIHDLWGRVGFSPTDKRVSFLGVSFKNNDHGKIRYDPFHRELQLSPRHLRQSDMKMYYDVILKFKPKYFYGLPSALCLFADYLLENKLQIENVNGILCGSENLSLNQRDLLSKALNASVYSWYGQTEKVILAGECENSLDYHVVSEYGYFELIDPSGITIKKPGILGEIVGTGFLNEAMPLIRYKTGDFAEYSVGLCPCGRPGPRICNVQGRRNDDYLFTKNGEKILFSSVETQKMAFSPISEWQFIQSFPGLVQVKIVRNNRITDNELNRIRQELNNQFKDKIDFEVFLSDEVTRTNRGKVKRIIQEI